MDHPVPSDAALQYVQDLSDEAIAAVELLGESPTEIIDGKMSIRIPADFPISEEELAGFYADAETVGLLHAIGRNENGVRQRVWELNQIVYDDVLLAMTYSSRSSPATAPTSSERSLEDQEGSTDEEELANEESDASFRPVPLTELREDLVRAEALRASSSAESKELKRQYQETVEDLKESTEQLTRLRAQVAALHAHRIVLKSRVKDANITHHRACVTRKQLKRSIATKEKMEMDAITTPILDLLEQEAGRMGLSLEQVLVEIRKRSARKEG